jgi:DNA-binding transcriptional regulator YdaS (Cro superfamily)
MNNALERAIDLLDGQAGLAASIGVKQQHIWNWLKRGGGKVPAEHCPSIERATRAKAAEKGDPTLIVTCEQLRHDVAWSVLREQIGVPATDSKAAA